MADGHITLKTEVDTSGAKAGAEKVKSILGGVGKAVTGLTTSVVALGVSGATAFVKWTKQTAAAGDRVDKLSQKIGMSRKSFQKWDYVLSQNGADIANLQVGMKTLSTAVVNGNDAFQKLGITQKELKDLDKEEIFERTIAALQEMPESAERSAIAAQLLGRSATDLEPLLNSSKDAVEALKKEAEDYGMVMSDASVTAAAAFSDSLDKMKRAMDGFKTRLTEEYMPIITKVTDGIAMIFSGKAEEGIQSIADGLEEFINKLGADLPVVLERLVEIVIKLFGSILQALPGLVKSIVDALPGIVKKIAEALPKLIPQLVNAIVECILYIVQNLSSIIGPLIDALPDILMSIINAIAENLPKLIQGGTSLINGIIKLIPKILEAVATVIPELLTTVISSIISSIPEVISSLVSVLWESTKAIPDSIIGIFKGLYNGLTGESGLNAKEVNSKNGVVVNKETGKTVTNIMGVPVGGGTLKKEEQKNTQEYETKNIMGVPVLVPKMAMGGVIPPNREFLAVLGDQTEGTNVEAPLDTIRQALAEVYQQYDGGRSETIILEIDGREIARATRNGEKGLGSNIMQGRMSYAY